MGWRITRGVSAPENVTSRTYRLELRRAVAQGVLETAGQTFLLLIAVRYLQAGPVAKGLVATGGSVGLVLSLVAVVWVTTRGWPPAQAAARLYAVGAGSFLVMAAVPVLPVFVAGSMVGLATMAMALPLLTQMYQDNYPADRRGKLYSRSVMVRVGTAALFAEVAGRWLAVDLVTCRWLLVVYAVAFAFGAGWLARCPSQPLTPALGSVHPLRALRFVREDRVFRLTLICWMLMGFANLMMLPLRVEYLANPRYGLALSAATVALLTGVIPNGTRLVLSPVWGWLFDRMNFFVLRAVLNLGFALGILTFFTSATTPGLVTGAILFGIANAGGDVAWTLWVTKFAPPHRVADYMSVHTFFTGLRGVAAPLVAFQLIGLLSLPTIGFIAAGMIFLASAILITEVRTRRAPDPGTTLVERSARD